MAITPDTDPASITGLIETTERLLLDGTVDDLCHELDDLEVFHAMPAYRGMPMRPPSAILLCLGSGCVWLGVGLFIYQVGVHLVL